MPGQGPHILGQRGVDQLGILKPVIARVAFRLVDQSANPSDNLESAGDEGGVQT